MFFLNVKQIVYVLKKKDGSGKTSLQDVIPIRRKVMDSLQKLIQMKEAIDGDFGDLIEKAIIELDMLDRFNEVTILFWDNTNKYNKEFIETFNCVGSFLFNNDIFTSSNLENVLDIFNKLEHEIKAGENYGLMILPKDLAKHIIYLWIKNPIDAVTKQIAMAGEQHLSSELSLFDFSDDESINNFIQKSHDLSGRHLTVFLMSDVIACLFLRIRLIDKIKFNVRFSDN